MRAAAQTGLLVLLVGCGQVTRTDDSGPGPDGGDGDDGDDDAGGDGGVDLPRLTVTGPSVREGDTIGGVAVFEVELSTPADGEVTVAFATADDTASTSAGDYQELSGTLVLPPGTTATAVEVSLLADFRSEPDERFRLRLEDPVGAVLATAEAAAVVRDDDRGLDFNGDGFADLLVGDPFAEAGEVYLFFGRPDLEPGGAQDRFTAADADVTFSGRGGDRQRFGAELAGGDVNGDGLDDVLVVATVGPPESAVAIVYVFAGSASPEAAVDAAEADASISGPAGPVPAANLAVVDLDGDGAADIVFGGNDGARLFAGSESLTGGLELGPADALATFVDGSANAFLPAGVGDFDGDGQDDLVVATAVATGDGTAHLFLGGTALAGQIGLAAADAAFAVEAAGADVLGAGGSDMNGDGLADVALGVPSLNVADGQVQVFYGRAAPGGELAADVTIASDAETGLLGRTVSIAGDLDGDGFADLVAGMPGADAPDAPNGGVGLIFLGASDTPPSLTSSARDVEVRADGGGDGLSEAIAVLDFNGDGFHDVAFGSPESGADNDGNVYLLLGFAGAFRDGPPVRAVSNADASFAAGATNANFGSALAE